MGLILLEYLLRLLSRSQPLVKKYIYIGYFLALIVQLLVMFSRVILGMHSFNEVLLGACLGLFCIVVYYLYTERLMVKVVATLLDTPQQFDYTRNLEEKSRNRMVIIGLVWIFILTSLIDFLVVYLPTFNYTDYWSFITVTDGC